MRYLLDANLSRHIADILTEAGFEASHVVEGHLWNASDDVIADHAIAHGQTVISADSDFATILALRRGSSPSLVLLRSMDRLAPAEQADILIANLPALEEELAEGAVASIGIGHVRVRRLPLK